MGGNTKESVDLVFNNAKLLDSYKRTTNLFKECVLQTKAEAKALPPIRLYNILRYQTTLH